MHVDEINRVLRKAVPHRCNGPRRDDGNYALPDASLSCLHAIIAERSGVSRVFEFGSERSTQVFLGAGADVTSLEDSARWLAETAASLSAEQRVRWSPWHAPLERVWHRGAPFLSWRESPQLEERLAAADLVLIDSPVLPPMREHALLLALRLARHALIVVDDANIPSVQRYCRRLAARNHLAHHFTPLGHGMFFCAPTAGAIDERRGVLNTLRVWRLYLIRRRFLPPPLPCAS